MGDRDLSGEGMFHAMQHDVESAAGLLILIIDDDDAVRESVGSLLTRLGHRVVAVGAGEEALQAVESGIEPDLVMLDLNMPGLGGGETLRRLRARRPAMEVLIVTGSDLHAGDAIAGERARILNKPFNLRELRRLLDSIEPASGRLTRRKETGS